MVSRDEVVILVHGTFAGDKEGSDIGSRWWQRGSETWRWLEENLPPGTMLQEGRLFHWSGANTQSARLSAATELLALLVELEKQDRGYHLVGHSHGGSIIWEALLSSQAMRLQQHLSQSLVSALERRRVLVRTDLGMVFTGNPREPYEQASVAFKRLSEELDLNQMRSWVTVGTPFLTHLPHGGLFAKGWRDRKFSLSGDVVLAGRVWPVHLSATALLFSFMCLGMSFIPEADLHQQWIGRLAWVIAGVASWRVVHKVRTRLEVGDSLVDRAKLARSTFARFSARWLGLFPPTDEAIAGLRALCPSGTPDYEQLIMPSAERTDIPEPVPPQIPILVRLNAPRTEFDLVPEVQLSPFGDLWSPRIGKAVYGAANKLVMPWVNRTLAKRLLRTAQGCDIPYADLVYVSTWPVPIRSGITGMPERVAEALENDAVSNAGELRPEIRQLIARAAMDGARLPAVLAHSQSSLAGKGLVHTSYFDNDDVLRLIRDHIADHSQSRGRAGRTVAGQRGRYGTGHALTECHGPADLRIWRAQHRDDVVRAVGAAPVQDSPLPGKASN